MTLRVAYPWTCGLLAIALFTGGCAGKQVLQTQPPVVGAVVEMPVLARNDVGALYVFLPAAVELTPVVVIEHDSERYGFLTSRVDDRSAQLLALGRVPVGWIADAVEEGAGVEFVESFDPELLSARDLSGSFGIWEGEGRAVDWIGDLPGGRQMGLVVPVSAVVFEGGMRALTETARGVVEIEGVEVEPADFDAAQAQAMDRFGPDEGPYLVIPDGNMRFWDQWFGIACLNSVDKCTDFSQAVSSVELGNAFQFEIVDEDRRFEKGWSSFETKVLTRELGANALLSMDEDGARVTLGRAVYGRRDLGVLMPLSIGDQAFEFGQSAKKEEVSRAVRAMGAMWAGHYLTAAYLLRDLPVEGGLDVRTGELQWAELLSAAGFSDWGRVEILRDRKAVDVGMAVGLARSFVHELDDKSALKYVEIALDGVGKKGSVRRAEILQLKARVLALSEDFKQAAVVAGEAAAEFKKVDRALEAAGMQVERAGYLVRAGDVRGGLAAGIVGRDGFLEQEQVYWAADAEMRLATLMIDYDQRSDAMDLLESARGRLVGTGHVGLLERVNMVGLLVRQQVQPGFDAVPGLLAAYERAFEKTDFEGAGFAASVLINTGYLGQGDERKGLVMGLVEGVNSLETREWSANLRVALAVSCFRGLEFDEVESGEKANFEAVCGPLVAEYVLTPKILPVWIGQAYRYLQAGEVGRAEVMVRELQALQEDVYLAKYPLRVAEVLMLEAVLLERQSADEEVYLGRVERALSLLKGSVAGEAFSGQVFQYSEQFRVRGIAWLAVFLRQKYVELADNEQEKAGRVVRFGQLLHEAGRWADLVELGVDGDSFESSMLALYQSDAAYELGDRKRALVLRDQAIKGDSGFSSREMFGLLKLAIEVDVQRGDLARARAVGEVVDTVTLDDADVQSEGARAALAGLLGARAELMALLGEHEEARRLFGASLVMFGELPVQASARVRAEVLEGWGRTAQGHEQLKDAIEHLELFQTQLSHVFEPAAARDARVALIRLMLLRSDVGRAQYQFGKLMDDGLSSGATAVSNMCLRGKIGFHFLFDSVSGSFGENVLFGGEDGQDILIQELQVCAEDAARIEDRVEAAWMASLIDAKSTLAERIASTRAYEKALPGEKSREVERLKYFIEIGTTKQESVKGANGLGAAVQLLGEMRPLAVYRHLEALIEDGVHEKHQNDAKVMFLLMQTSVILCRWDEAGYWADLFEKHVTDSRDAQTLAKARALGKRFSL